ncbi:hypothetical protein GALMADRAFT_258926 [Galerina marginata CBS 339.88]|uniref:Uncharacterized protein n=1 Tax=Galerina marginata (strain CBS 339.88) TaxID=685588 RepID=A0A067S7D7_GALM3|nr:hypothetical protein GALMADRAFT_258926 [Galerina marginata CBS 339.88]
MGKPRHILKIRYDAPPAAYAHAAGAYGTILAPPVISVWDTGGVGFDLASPVREKHRFHNALTTR